MNVLSFVRLFILYQFVAQQTYAQHHDTTIHLQDFVFKIVAPVKVKGDTVSYTIDSFTVNQHSSTEDVLKRLPGVEVIDGKITAQGKEVRKIFINGKEYNSSEFATLTQNLPAGVVDKIEFADWIDEDAQFTGRVTSREDKVMHLKLRKQYERGLSGQVSAGGGSQQRQQSNLFANYMHGASRVTVTGTLNNTGINGTGMLQSPQGTGINERKNGTVNTTTDLSNRATLTASYDVTDNRQLLLSSRFRTSFLAPDSVLYNQQERDLEKRALSHRLNAQHLFKINKQTQLRTQVSLATSISQSQSDQGDRNFEQANPAVPVFQRVAAVGNKTTAPTGHLQTTLNRKWRKSGRVLTLSGSVDINSQTTASNNSNLTITTGQSLTRFYSEEKNNGWSGQLSVQHIEPLSARSNLRASYTLNQQNGKSDRTVWVSDDERRWIDTVQSQQFDNRNTEQRLGLYYQQRRKYLEVNMGMDGQYFVRNSTRTGVTDRRTIAQSGLNYFPTALVRMTLPNKTVADFTYNGTINTPTLQQLQAIPDYTDSLNITIGNPALRPEVRNNFQLHINQNKEGAQRNLWIRLCYSFTSQQIINQTELTASRRMTKPVNADGAFQISFSAGYGTALIPKKLRVQTGLSADLARNVSFVNDGLVRLMTYTIKPHVRLLFTQNGLYDGSVEVRGRLNDVIGGIARVPQQTLNYQVSHDGSFQFEHGFKVQYQTSFQANEGLSAGYDQPFWVIHAGAEKQFEKPKGLGVRLQGFDLLNQYPVVQRNTGDNYVEDRRVNRLGRFVLLSAVYRFQYWRKGYHEGM